VWRQLPNREFTSVSIAYGLLGIQLSSLVPLARTLEQTHRADVDCLRSLHSRGAEYLALWEQDSAGMQFGQQAAANVTGEASRRLAPVFFSEFGDLQKDLARIKSVARRIPITTPPWQQQLHEPLLCAMQLRFCPDAIGAQTVRERLHQRIAAAEGEGNDGLMQELRFVERALDYPFRI